MIVQPKVRGFICTTAHPKGCRKNVEKKIEYIKSKGDLENGPKNVLVIGASTGFGLVRLLSYIIRFLATLGHTSFSVGRTWSR